MKTVLSILFCFWSVFAHADTPTFDNLSDDDFKSISKDFSALFLHTSVTPPTPLGKVFGFEAGLIAGAAKIPDIEAISKRFDPSMNLSTAPYAVLYGAVSVPMGFTFETNILPKTTVSGLDLQHYSLGAKWTITDNFLEFLPFALAVKAYYSQSKVGFEQTETAPIASTVHVNFDDTMTGADLLMGWDFPILQPYVGAGYVTANSKLASHADLDPTYSMFADNVSQSKKTDVSSLRLTAGVQFNLALMKLGLEYNRVFDTDRAALKIAFGF